MPAIFDAHLGWNHRVVIGTCLISGPQGARPTQSTIKYVSNLKSDWQYELPAMLGHPHINMQPWCLRHGISFLRQRLLPSVPSGRYGSVEVHHDWLHELHSLHCRPPAQMGHLRGQTVVSGKAPEDLIIYEGLVDNDLLDAS